MSAVLLIEDSPGEARIMQEAFRMVVPEVKLSWVKNGKEALDFLAHNEPFQDEGLPNLILLDLNMPGIDGRDLLSRFKSDQSINHIPVVVLSNSVYSKDIDFCYKLNVNCYLAKPSGFSKVTRLVELVNEFWLNTAKMVKEE